MLQDAIERVKGVGEKTATLFHKEGIFTKEDLILGFPISYREYPAPVLIQQARDKEWMAFSGVLKEDFRGNSGNAKGFLFAKVFDQSGEIILQYFHAPYIRKVLKKGMQFVFFGQVREFKGSLYLQQAKYFSPEEYREKQRCLEAIYSGTKGMKSYVRRKAIAEIFKEDFRYPDLFSEEDLERLSLRNKKESLRLLHFPRNFKEREEGRRRFAFEELFFYSLYLEKEEKEYKKVKETVLYQEGEEEDFQSYFPFALTNSQKNCITEMNRELLEKKRIFRFVEGDVGSGKTVIAFYLLYLTMKRKKQVAFMAPTEILARQHYENALKLFPNGIALLLGSTSLKEKKRIYKDIAEGKILGVFGTQSLIQELVHFQDLESIIIDEQHRFGVKERRKLEEKGKFPHALFLSATPIPRSLAKLLYGSLPLSVLQEKPADRLPIKNALIHKEEQGKAFSFILEEIQKGRQAYVICPMIEENENLEVESVLSYEKLLRKSFPENVRISVLHGKMKAEQKEEVMEAFKQGKTQILLSTTVVEVGVDVGNATVMLIENAERFGLAQLHQLRGRVGRSALQSYCIFLDRKDDEKSRERLEIIKNSNDGFSIAKEDLRLRGPGDLFFGERQSGDLQFHMADPILDEALFRDARLEAERILKQDPTLERHEKLQNAFLKMLEADCP